MSLKRINLKDLILLPSDVVELVDTALPQMFIWDFKEVENGRRYFPEQFLGEVSSIGKAVPGQDELSVTKEFAIWIVEQIVELCSIAWPKNSQEMRQLLEAKEKISS